MKKSEFKDKVKILGIDLEQLNIVIGRKTNVPNSIGCYEENGIWHFYDVNERQSLVVTKSGTEDEVFSYLYLLTEALSKKYIKL